MMTREELEAKLDQAVADGSMTPEEAEDEWQDFMHRGEDSYLGVYGW